MSEQMLNNFIPQRMRGQSFSIGKIPLTKVFLSIILGVIPFIILYFILKGQDNFITSMLVGGLMWGGANQGLVWFPTKSGHSLIKLLFLAFNFKSSYNHFKNATECEIFDLYKLKTNSNEVNKHYVYKLSQLKRNNDGSYSPKNYDRNLREDLKNLPPNIFAINDGLSNSKVMYMSIIKINGYDITHASADTKQSLIMGLHAIEKSIDIPYSLIKIKQPTNLAQNLDGNDINLSSITHTTMMNEQLLVKQHILQNNRIQLSRDLFSYQDTAVENNWFLVLHHYNVDNVKLTLENLSKSFNGLKIGTQILNKREIFNVLVSVYAPYICFNDKNIVNVDDIDSYKSLLNFNTLKFTSTHVEVIPKLQQFYPQSKNIKTYMKIGVIDKYPTTNLSFAWLYTLSSAVDTVVIHNTPLPKDKLQKMIDASFSNTELTHGMTRSKSKKKESEFLYQSFEMLANAIGSGNETVIESNIYTINYSLNHEKEVNESFKQSESALKSIGFVLRPLTFQQRAGFSDLFIKNKLFLNKYLIPMPNYVFAISYPFISTTINDKFGTLLGKTDKKELFIFDLFNLNATRTNANQFVIGKSGAGKSTYLKKLWMHEYAKGNKVILIDPENENSGIVKNLKGTNVDLLDTPLNPLEINIFKLNTQNQYEYDIDAKCSWLTAWFSTIFGWGPSQEDQTKKIYLTNYLIKFYKYFRFDKYVKVNELKYQPNFPSISEFYSWLKQNLNDDNMNMYEKDIINCFNLNFIDSDMITKKLWNNKNSLKISESDLINFDISKIQNLEDALKRAMYMFVLDLANKEVWKNRLFNDKVKQSLTKEQLANFYVKHILVIVDEAHLLIDKKSPEALSFLAETVKRIRKYDGALIVATQNINDFIADDVIKKESTALINNCQTSVSLGLAPNDIKVYDELLSSIGGLTEQEKNYLGGAVKGDCLYILGGFNRIQVRIDISNDVSFLHYANSIKVDKQ